MKLSQLQVGHVEPAWPSRWKRSAASARFGGARSSLIHEDQRCCDLSEAYTVWEKPAAKSWEL